MSNDSQVNDESQLELVRVKTGARLHFGLFDVKPPFGGVGLMVDHPRTSVAVSSSSTFEVLPYRAERIVEIAKQVAKRLPASLLDGGLPRCKVVVEAAADSHCGLGSGTQLALATAVSMCQFFSLDLSRHELVHDIASRGRRSSIGSIGFFEGGLISEEGKDQRYEPGPAWQRIALPTDWRIVLACPQDLGSGISGEAEGAAFAALPAASPEYRANLVQLCSRLMKSGENADFDSFCSLISRFNSLSGELFAAHQGGCYNGEQVLRLVRRIESLGEQGVGQSSWGPTVFAVCKNQEAANNLRDSLTGIACRVVKPQASGYVLERSPSTSCK
jgi:beta-ribofuranosylaminobenzene 5'-phosphate synthase